MKNIFFFLISIVIFSCSKSSNDDEVITGVFIDTTAFVFLKNSNGNNLINSESFPSQNFKFYTEINGVKTLFNMQSSDLPRGFRITELESVLCLSTSFNSSNTPATSNYYIEWNSLNTDKFTVSYEKNGSTTEISKILLNDNPVPVWYSGMQSKYGRTITVVK